MKRGTSRFLIYKLKRALLLKASLRDFFSFILTTDLLSVFLNTFYSVASILNILSLRCFEESLQKSKFNENEVSLSLH